MGSPDFAIPALKRIIEDGHEVVGVVSVPDKPMGRGKKITPMPVKAEAVAMGLDVYTPETLRDGAFSETLASLDPEVIVVVAYGKILPLYILDYPKYGCINIHGSLLPEYRGAAPMQRAIIDGKEKTGITTMYMAQGLDTGDMLLKKEYVIAPDDNFECVHDALSALGAEAISETLKMAEAGTLKREVQDDSLSSYAEKITKEECRLDFSLDARSLHNRIRGTSPVPLSYTKTPDGAQLKIVKAKISDKKPSDGTYPGTVISLDRGYITVACGVGAIDIEAVLPEGKGRMNARDFINGRRIKTGDLLG